VKLKKNLAYGLGNKQKGFLVLTLVLLVCATVLAIASGVFLRSIGKVNEVGESEYSFKAWSAVNACGEYALGRMASIASGQPGWAYQGNELLTIGGQTCYIYGIITEGETKVIHASSTVSNFTKKLVIEVATNTPKVVINSWREVADF
jgi:hypothetical protein